MHMSFVTASSPTRGQVGPLFDWYSTATSSSRRRRDEGPHPRPICPADGASIGSMVIGRHLFDMTNGWEGSPPAGDTFVVSHRPEPADPPRRRLNLAIRTHVGNARITSSKISHRRSEGRALRRSAPSVAAGDVGGQALALALVDEVAMYVVPPLPRASVTSGRSMPSICSSTRTRIRAPRASPALQGAPPRLNDARSDPLYMSMSLDGFIAGPDDRPGQEHARRPDPFNWIRRMSDGPRAGSASSWRPGR